MDRFLLLLLALVGCSAESGPVPMKPGHSYAMEGELAELAPVVLDRLRLATCLELGSGETGTPVRRGEFKDDPATAKDESAMCGLTVIHGYGLAKPEPIVTRTEITIAEPMPDGCPDLETALLHEVIHELRRDLPVTVGHTAEFGPGVFAAHAGWREKLIEADLLAICELQDCRCFNPEEE